MKEIEATKEAILKIIELSDLLKSSNPESSRHMMTLVKEMDNWYSTKENLYKFNGLCHAKALGDNAIPGYDSNEWQALVSTLHNKCAVAFNLLERLPKDKREAYNKSFKRDLRFAAAT